MVIKNWYQLVLVCMVLHMRCGRAQVGYVGKEKDALDALRTSFNHPFLNHNWTGSAHPCFMTEPSTWYGVQCGRFDSNNTGRVTGITLASMQLNGSIHVDAFGDLNELSILALNNNSLRGNMMDFTLNQKLTSIDISGNAFHGQISDSVLSLRILESLLLQDNEFEGEIPELNQSITTFRKFNVSNNNLNGSIPKTRALQAFGYDSYSGNPGLCGPPSPIACYVPVRSVGKKSVSDYDNKKYSKSNLYMFLLDVAGLVVVVLLFILYYNKSRKLNKAMKELANKTKSSSASSIVINIEEKKDIIVHDDTKKKIAMEEGSGHHPRRMRSSDGAAAAAAAAAGPQEDPSSNNNNNNNGKRGKLVFVGRPSSEAADQPVFEMADLLKGSAEGLGKGIFGNSYKAEITTNNMVGSQIKQAVVVKRLRDLKPLVSGEFTKQLQVIANLKHPNLLPLLAYYLSKEEKLLLYHYVRNGNLFYRIFGERGPDRIPFWWSSRLAVARDVGRALEYLHASSTSSSSTAPHGNLKSSNVLLDEKDGVLVSDYGFASLVAIPIAAKRMVSYKSPEYYKTKKVSKESDVWSYGSLCLELLTGKISACTAPPGVNGTDLCSWVNKAVREEWTAEIFDTEISTRRRASSGMLRLLQIAMRCCDPSPEKRPEMREVVREVENIRVAELEADDDEDSLTDDSATDRPPPTRVS